MNNNVEKIRIKKDSNSFLFKIISKCNDSCNFCLEYEFIRSRRPDLSFKEFKKNYEYLKKRITPDYIILTGGEPTLHSQFFKMLNFLKQHNEGFRFITNLLIFNNKNFVKKIKKVFSNYKNKKQKELSKIIVSINDLPGKNKNAQKRYSGLKNAFLAKLPLIVTILIYRGNLDDLVGLAKLLRDSFEKYQPSDFLHVEFRLMYIEGTLPKLLKISLPTKFGKLKKSVEDSIKILNTPKIKVTLWNFPLCYLDNPESAKNEAIAERQARRLVKIYKDRQLDRAEIREWEAYLKPHQECRKCKYRDLCSGIDQKYITEHGFPKLRPKL